MENQFLAEKFDHFTHDLFKIYKVQRFFLLILLLVLTASFIVPQLEKSYPNAKIQSFGDGLWWSIITITTVGYGDKVPLSPWGKVIGSLLAISGVILLGITISMFALYFGRKREDFYSKRNYKYLDNLTREVEALRKEVEFLVKKK